MSTVSLAEVVAARASEIVRGIDRVRPQERGALVAKRLIQARVARGIDRHGRPFAPYARATLAKRARLGLPLAPVALRTTGQMLGTLAVKSGQTLRMTATVAPTPGRNQRLTRIHRAGSPRRRLPSRDYFGLTTPERAEVERAMGAVVQEARRVGPGGRVGRGRVEIRVTL